MGIVSKCFKNNMPGDDWISNFVKRNQLSKRAASNIKRSMSAVKTDVINKYFHELEAFFERLGMFFSFFPQFIKCLSRWVPIFVEFKVNNTLYHRQCTTT